MVKLTEITGKLVVGLKESRGQSALGADHASLTTWSEEAKAKHWGQFWKYPILEELAKEGKIKISVGKQGDLVSLIKWIGH